MVHERVNALSKVAFYFRSSDLKVEPLCKKHCRVSPRGWGLGKLLVMPDLESLVSTSQIVPPCTIYFAANSTSKITLIVSSLKMLQPGAFYDT